MGEGHLRLQLWEQLLHQLKVPKVVGSCHPSMIRGLKHDGLSSPHQARPTRLNCEFHRYAEHRTIQDFADAASMQGSRRVQIHDARCPKCMKSSRTGCASGCSTAEGRETVLCSRMTAATLTHCSSMLNFCTRCKQNGMAWRLSQGSFFCCRGVEGAHTPICISKPAGV